MEDGLNDGVNQVQAGYQDKDAANFLENYCTSGLFSRSYIAGRHYAQTIFIKAGR